MADSADRNANKRNLFSSGERSKRPKVDEQDGQVPVPRANEPPQISQPPATVVNAEQALPPVVMTHLNLEKAQFLREDGTSFMGLALVDKSRRDLSSSSASQVPPHRRCLNADIGIQVVVKDLPRLDCFLVRKTFLSYHMSGSVVTPVNCSTTSTMLINGLEYRVFVRADQDFCLAVLDRRKFSHTYSFALEGTDDARVLRLVMVKLPICQHNTGGAECVECASQRTAHFVFLRADFQAGQELWRGNWGEVWTANWCEANDQGSFRLFDPNCVKIACKRFFNVMKCQTGPLNHAVNRYLYFQDRFSDHESAWHLICIANPSEIHTSHDLRECFARRLMVYLENPMNETEVLQYVAGLVPPRGRFLSLGNPDAFGICSHNLYVLTELLPSASFANLLGRMALGRGVTAPTARRIMRHLIESVYILHHSSIAHCDLKPENIAFRIAATHVFDAGFGARVAARSAAQMAADFTLDQLIADEDFTGLIPVLIDFGQAQWRPGLTKPHTISPTHVAALSNPDLNALVEDPLKSRKLRDLRKMGGVLFHLSTGMRLPREPIDYVDVCARFRQAHILSDPGVVQLLEYLLLDNNCSAEGALVLPWLAL